MNATVNMKTAMNFSLLCLISTMLSHAQLNPILPNPFGAKTVVPASVSPDVPFDVLLAGEFPSAAYTFVSKEQESAGNVHFFKAVTKPPDGPAATVITPFEELIGKLTLSTGEHYIRTVLNDEEIAPVKIVAGDVPLPDNIQNEWVSFRRTGGFAGDNSWLKIDTNGNYAFSNRFKQSGAIETGTLSRSLFHELKTMLEESKFPAFPWVVKPATTVADAFQYEVVYQNFAVTIYFLEAAPEGLQAIVRRLESVMNEPQQASSIRQDNWKNLKSN